MGRHPLERQNPLCSAGAEPAWSQLIRLAGDRAAIRFQELRKLLAKTEGVFEELQFFGPLDGWAPRYRMGEITLCAVHLLPGALEASLEIDPATREKMLASSRIPERWKAMIRDAPLDNGRAWARFALANLSAVRAFAALVRMKRRWVERGQVADHP